MPYQRAAKKVRTYLTQIISQEGLNFKTINDICTAVVRGIIEEFPGRYIDVTTGEDCWYVDLIAGGSISKGMSVVYPQDDVSKSVVACPTSGDTIDMNVGISLDTVTVGQPVRIAVKGLALGLPDAAITAAKGSVVYASATTAGRLNQATNIGAAQHWQETGHWAADGTGNGALTLLHIHHN